MGIHPIISSQRGHAQLGQSISPHYAMAGGKAKIVIVQFDNVEKMSNFVQTLYTDSTMSNFVNQTLTYFDNIQTLLSFCYSLSHRLHWNCKVQSKINATFQIQLPLDSFLNTMEIQQVETTLFQYQEENYSMLIFALAKLRTLSAFFIGLRVRVR